MNEATHFFVLGAMKAGTTSLADYLAQHPDILLSKPKETRFFETEEYNNGIEHYLRKYYPEWRGESVIGEASPDNLYLPYVPGRIRDNFPDVRLICILRNPVDRAYSHWRMFYLGGLEALSFEDAISAELEGIKAGGGLYFGGEEGARRWNERMRVSKKVGRGMSKNYVDSGFYARQIKIYLELFPESRMKVVFFDDLVKNPQSVVSGLWDFLGVDPSVKLKDDAPRNPTYKSRIVYFLAKKIGFATKLNLIMPVSIKVRLAGIFAKIGKEQSMSAETRRKLIEHFYSHNRELESLLGRDLSNWDR